MRPWSGVNSDYPNQRAGLVERLAEVLAEINSRLDPDAARAAVVSAAVDLVSAAAGGFISLEGDQLVIRATEGLPASTLGYEFPPGIGALRDTLDTGEPLYIGDYHSYPQRSPELAGQLREFNTLIVAPCHVRDRIVGALFLMFLERDHPVTAAELEILSLLAAHGAIAAGNADAYRQVLDREHHERDVIDALNDGVAVVRDDGAVLSWSAAAARITGIKADEVVGRSFPLPTDPTGQPLVHQLESDRWVEIRTTPLSGETVVALRDVSKEKAFEEAQRLFLATTTHEFKTPLTVINGMASTLQSRWDDLTPEIRKEALHSITKRGDSLVKLIDQLLLGWRAEAGQVPVDIAPFDLAHAAESASAGFGSVSDSHRVLVEVAPDLPLALGDPRAIEQMVGQLLENALKYSPEGGTITVKTGRSELGVCVAVTDQGIGFAPEDADRIFSRYFRSATGKSAASAGIGLGLFIVRALAEAQGGTVTATSDPGNGSTFTVCLPVAGAARQ